MDSLYEVATTGETLTPLTLPPISRGTLALFAGASADHNLLHIDSDVAKQAGYDDVFAHGMLVMAYLGRYLTTYVSQVQVRSFSVRFLRVTRVGESLTCRGKVAERLEIDGSPHVRVALVASNQEGETKLTGEAVLLVHRNKDRHRG